MKRILLIMLTLVFFAGCGTTSSKVEDANAASDMTVEAPVVGALDGVEVAGYCPVAYVEAGKPVKGSAEYASVRDGKTYWFVNEGARDLYEKSPNKYDVAYDGWCATGLAYGKRIPSDPTVFSVHDGRVFLFSNADAKAAFEADVARLTADADTNWSSLASK